MPQKVIIIGCGFAGLSAASFMAKQGWEVLVLEKHDSPGGRARQLCSDGFKFDMGPSWYWMPDIFERFFSQFGKTTSDFYTLQRLNPSYRIYWPDEVMDVPSNYRDLKLLFEEKETGGGSNLDLFLKEAGYKYRVGMRKLALQPGRSILEFLNWDLLIGMINADVFTSLKKHVEKHFKHPKLRLLMEFPILFLGALPENTPALYSLMNFADMKLGTWFPVGGMFSVVKGMYELARELDVEFKFNQDVSKIILENKLAKKVITQQKNEFHADAVIGSADYHFIEEKLLDSQYRSYSEKYWDSRIMAPSCLIYYVGLNTTLKGMSHHSLFFDTPFEDHAREIYLNKKWPSQPLFYVNAPSVTDRSLAPPGCENLFFLIPVAAGLEGDSAELRDKYFQIIAERFSQKVGTDIMNHVVFKKTYGPTDFERDYNSYKGNAYGLANTLRQTAHFKPACRSRRVHNLFYAGQLTVPGPGVPPSLLSGELVAQQVVKYFG